MDTSNSAKATSKDVNILLNMDSPLQPMPTMRRVKNAGMEFMNHDNTCYWIRHMQEEEPNAPLKTTTRQQNSAQAKIIHESIMPHDVAVTTCHTGNYDGLNAPTPCPVSEISPVQLFQQQQIQQQQLLEQQKLLREQQQLIQSLQEENRRHFAAKDRLPEVASSSSPSSTVKGEQSMKSSWFSNSSFRNISGESPFSQKSFTDGINATAKKEPACRAPRRLRGRVAQLCAQRDEGSIGNLIWCDEPICSPKPSDTNMSRTHLESCSLEARAGRRSERSASSSSVQQPAFDNKVPLAVCREYARRAEEGSLQDLIWNDAESLNNTQTTSSKPIKPPSEPEMTCEVTSLTEIESLTSVVNRPSAFESNSKSAIEETVMSDDESAQK